MIEQQAIASGDVLDWLLETENPPVRYAALTALLGRPADDPEVRRAREAISAYPPVAALLAAQNAGGYWAGRDYYLPKHEGTFWVLSVLADLGLTAEEAHVERGCAFMFAHQRDDGAFPRRYRTAGSGRWWEAQPEPCTHARILRFLVQFGYDGDPRVSRAIDWLMVQQRADAMWLCARGRGRGCLRATLDYLRLAATYPPLAGQPATQRAAASVCELLLARGMGRYHVSDAWRILTYPYFGYSIVSALDALLSLGYGRQEPKIAGAVDYLLGRRRPDGSWPIDEEPQRPPFSVGQAGAPNQWLTLDALRVLRRLQNAPV